MDKIKRRKHYAEYVKRKAQNDPEWWEKRKQAKRNDNMRRYRENPEVRERHKTFREKYVKQDPDYHKKIYQKRKAQGYYLKQYNLSLDEYNARLESQGNRCPICGSDFKEVITHVDHDHKTGQVRGLLCQQCNIMLGAAKDNKEILLRAIDYLAQFPVNMDNN